MQNTRPKIVVIGGGTGSHAILRGLKHHDIEITAIVAMTDRGGSSGRLRDEFGHLPPGDVRQCLAALAPEEHGTLLLRQLFSYRFARGSGLSGHSFGNIFITALVEITGSTDKAIEEAGNLLGIKGRVIPVTLSNTDLCARLVDGTMIVGEHKLDVRREKPDVPIDYVYLDPRAYVNPEAERAIREADAVVLGPGDLYTSLVANLVVEGVAQAIVASSATKLFVCNLATKRGESDGFAASDFVRVLLEYLGREGALDVLLVNSTQPSARVRTRYESEGSHVVQLDEENCRRLVPNVIAQPLASAGTYLRHDPELLASAVLNAAGLSRSEQRAASSNGRGADGSAVRLRATVEHDGRNASRANKRRPGKRPTALEP
jgi:uncharacterized cofD-like protein